MQKTTHLDLCTWAESDPVSLEQMNGNFTKLDTAGANTDAHLTKHDSALALVGFHTAQGALENLHAGALGDRRRNLVLADFAKTGQWAEVYRLNLNAADGAAPTAYGADGKGVEKPVPAASGFSELSAAILPELIAASSNNDYYLYRSNGQTQTFAEFLAPKNGTVTNVLVSLAQNGNAWTLVVLDNGAQAAVVTQNAVSNTTRVESVTVSFPLYAGHKYTLQYQFRSDAGSSEYVQVRTFANQTGYTGMTFPKLSGSGSTYSTGWFKTQAFTVKQAGTLRLWLTHQGTRPVVQFMTNTGVGVRTMNLVTTDTVTSLSGAACKRAELKLEGVTAGTYQLKVTVPDATCMVEELCGMVL